MPAQIGADACEIAMRVWFLHVRGEQPEAAFEDLCRTRNARSRQQRRRDSALRRPSWVQELGLRAVHPTLQQSRGEATCDARRLGLSFGVESQYLAGEIGCAESCEQSGGMKAALVQF